MDSLTIKLNANQTNVVLAGLAELPYKISAETISVLHSQLQTQVESEKEKELLLEKG